MAQWLLAVPLDVRSRESFAQRNVQRYDRQMIGGLMPAKSFVHGLAQQGRNLSSGGKTRSCRVAAN